MRSAGNCLSRRVVIATVITAFAGAVAFFALPSERASATTPTQDCLMQLQDIQKVVGGSQLGEVDSSNPIDVGMDIDCSEPMPDIGCSVDAWILPSEQGGKKPGCFFSYALDFSNGRTPSLKVGNECEKDEKGKCKLSLITCAQLDFSDPDNIPKECLNDKDADINVLELFFLDKCKAPGGSSDKTPVPEDLIWSKCDFKNLILDDGTGKTGSTSVTGGDPSGLEGAWDCGPGQEAAEGGSSNPLEGLSKEEIEALKENASTLNEQFGEGGVSIHVWGEEGTGDGTGSFWDSSGSGSNTSGNGQGTNTSGNGQGATDELSQILDGTHPDLPGNGGSGGSDNDDQPGKGESQGNGKDEGQGDGKGSGSDHDRSPKNDPASFNGPCGSSNTQASNPHPQAGSGGGQGQNGSASDGGSTPIAKDPSQLVNDHELVPGREELAYLQLPNSGNILAAGAAAALAEQLIYHTPHLKLILGGAGTIGTSGGVAEAGTSIGVGATEALPLVAIGAVVMWTAHGIATAECGDECHAYNREDFSGAHDQGNEQDAGSHEEPFPGAADPHFNPPTGDDPEQVLPGPDDAELEDPHPDPNPDQHPRPGTQEPDSGEGEETVSPTEGGQGIVGSDGEGDEAGEDEEYNPETDGSPSPPDDDNDLDAWDEYMERWGKFEKYKNDYFAGQTPPNESTPKEDLEGILDSINKKIESLEGDLAKAQTDEEKQVIQDKIDTLEEGKSKVEELFKIVDDNSDDGSYDGVEPGRDSGETVSPTGYRLHAIDRSEVLRDRLIQELKGYIDAVNEENSKPDAERDNQKIIDDFHSAANLAQKIYALNWKAQAQGDRVAESKLAWADINLNRISIVVTSANKKIIQAGLRGISDDKGATDPSKKGKETNRETDDQKKVEQKEEGEDDNN